MPPSPEIECRPLGRTGLSLSIAGFGASPLGDVFGRTDPAESVRAVHYAIDRGINFFDVSPYYGITLAETRLGEALEGYRDRAILATKCGRYGDAEFDFSARRITAGVEDSLRRLRTGYVDLLQAHDVEFGDVSQIVHETLPAMRRLQQQGKARHIGISGYSLSNLKQIAEQVEVDSILSYCRYNLLVNDMDASLAVFAEQRGIGLINASALHMGLLTERGAPDWHPAPPEVRAAAKKVVAFCKSRGVDASELALRFCFEYPRAASTLVGMATTENVDACRKALAAKNDPAFLAEVQQLLAPVHNRTWPSGLPQNQ